MKMPACRRSIVFLVISSALWTSATQAFFCFSMGGGGRQRDNHYPAPPYGAFGAAGLPVPYYTRPLMPQLPVAPVESREVDYPAPIVPVAPVETRDVDYPAQDVSFPKQHIFH
jgi:hypothetical protein